MSRVGSGEVVLYDLDLRDKSDGYGVGPGLVVHPCRFCGRGGVVMRAADDSAFVVHSVRYVERDAVVRAGAAKGRVKRVKVFDAGDRCDGSTGERKAAG